MGDDIAFRAGDADIVCTPVSVGNPHAVIFADDVEEIPLTVLGPQIEHHENFPGGVNVEFVQVLSEKELRMRVWERGQRCNDGMQDRSVRQCGSGCSEGVL